MTETVPSVHVSSGFLNKKTPFDALIRRLQKITPQAIELLVQTMEDNTSKDQKLKVEAAKCLINVHVGLIKTKNDDKLKRMENQIRYLGKQESDGDFSTADEDDETVLIDFDNVQEIT